MDNAGFTLHEPEPTQGGQSEADAPPKKGAAPLRVRRRDAVSALLSGVDLWRGTDGAAYASVLCAGGRLEHVAVKSAGFRQWVVGLYLERHAAALSGQAQKEVETLAEARALMHGETRTAWRRWAFSDGVIWLDLGGGAWTGERRVVRIAADGWETLPDAPVAFLRGADALPMPPPEHDAAKPEDLRRFVNVADEDGLRLAWAWLCCAARAFADGEGSYPLLLLHGEQGSGKSNATRRLQALVDPAKSAGRGLPREDRDLFVSAVQRHLLAFDNVSTLGDWFSDSLCRIATGGAFSSRALHTDADEVVFSVARPLLLNGIPSTILHRPDLADRAISLECVPLRSERRTDAELNVEFAALRPGLLAVLCDALSAGLRRIATTRLEHTPRMADAATWAEACASGLGFDDGAILAAWHANRDANTRAALEADDVASTVGALLDAEAGRWSGTPADLYRRLSDLAGDRSRSQLWPRNASGLGTKLKRIAPGLRAAYGVEVEYGRRDGRWWSLRRA